MLLTLLLLSVTFVLSSLYGVVLCVFISKKYNLQSSGNLFLTTASGLMFLSIPVRLLHFFIPVSLMMFLFIGVGGVFIYRIYRHEWMEFISGAKNKWQQLTLAAKAGWVLSFITVLYNFLSRNNGFDTGAYHLQAIQWFETYKVVSGLGNLIEQISFNSQWFLLQAFFSFRFIGVPSMYVLNLLLVMLFIFDWLCALTNSLSKWNIFRLVGLVYLPAMLLGKAVSSPTPDIPVTLFTIYLLLYALENRKTLWGRTDALLLIVLPVFLVSIKLSALPMLLLSGLILYTCFANWRKIFLPVVAVGALVLIPWVVSTFIQSGYWVFPVKQTAFPKTEWTVPDKVTNRVHVEIKGWARAPYIDFKTNGTQSPIALLERLKTKLTGMHTGDYVDIEKVSTMTFTEWLPIWFQRLNVVNLVLVLFTFATGVLLFFVLLVRRKEVAGHIRQQFLLAGIYVIIVAGLLFWFINAPDLRFSHGVILPFIGANLTLAFYLLWPKLSFQKWFVKMPVLLCMALLGGNYLFFHSFYPAQLVSNTLIKPLPYITPVLLPKQIPGGTVQVATYPQKCWNSPLPCTCIFYEGLQYRGTTIEEGFVIRER